MKLLLLACVLTLVYGDSPRVRVREGELVGTTYTLPNKRTVFAFLGIPFAAPPIGNYRFKEPNPPKPWSGTRNATAVRNVCKQVLYAPGYSGNQVIGDEDCLNLNIYTPKLPKYKREEQLMNVLVYIVGGAFNVESGNDAIPDYILQYGDIVFVNLNYRVGALGFFSADDTSAPGNYGLKDQVAALRWVKRNIRHFGGDPNKVTIYGDSAGGASVMYLVVSPLTNGLFQSAYAASRSVALPWSLPVHGVDISLKLASALGCNRTDIKKMMECLRNKPAEDIVQEAWSPNQNGLDLVDTIFGPVIEPEHRGAFLTENPRLLLKEGRFKQIPFMTSVVQREGSVIGLGIVTNDTLMDKLNDQWNEFAPKLFFYSNLTGISKSDENRISSEIKTHYLGNEGVSNQNAIPFMQALGDRLIYNGLFENAKILSSALLVNAYCFKLYYRGTESVSDLLPSAEGKNYGVCHGDDSFYILKSPKESEQNQTDKDMAKLLCTSIIAFMKEGNPNTQNTIQWKPLSKNGKMNCLAIYSPTNQTMEYIENHKTTRFWNDLLPQENDF